MTPLQALTETAKALIGRRLERPQARPKAGTLRSPWGDDMLAETLDPSRLARLLRQARDGDAVAYLSVAQQAEERDLVYRASLHTRKMAIQGLDVQVVPGDDTPAAQDAADQVQRHLVAQQWFGDLIYDLADAIAKGYAVCELRWRTTETPWLIDGYAWRDPGWYQWDRETGSRLMLRTESGGEAPLHAYAAAIHVARSKSGPPVRGGLALPVLYYHLIKSYTAAHWAAFVEVYGYPLRLGKYGKGATAEDKDVLERAVANIGRDIGAVIPDDMDMEIVSGVVPGSATDYFQELADWCDRQTILGVLGQTATTEGTPGRLGADTEQGRVRTDILRSDARQMSATLTRDLARPWVLLNLGQVPPPTIALVVEAPEDVAALVEAVDKLVRLGLRVRTADVYPRLRLTPPADDDEVLAAPAPPAAPELHTALNAQAAARAAGQSGEAELDELLGAVDWEPMTANIHAAVTWLAEQAGSYEEARRRLPELLDRLDSDQVTMALADTLLRARGIGDGRFRDAE